MKATESGYEFILFSNKITSFHSVCFITETPESMQQIFLILQFQWYNIKLNIHFIGLIMKKLNSVLNLSLLVWYSLICPSLFQIPLRLIESLEMKDLFWMDVNCKDARSYRWDNALNFLYNCRAEYNFSGSRIHVISGISCMFSCHGMF